MNYKEFEDYLKREKGASENTIIAYIRDIKAFDKFMEKEGRSIDDATKTDVLAYLLNLNKEGKSKATSNRKLASLRMCFNWMIGSGLMKDDPTKDIKSPRAERRDLDYLTVSEVEQILDEPDTSIKGLRDKAILEVLYGTGMRVNELIDLNYTDLNLKMGYISCSGKHGKARIVPLGSYAKKAVEDYILKSRAALLRSEERDRDEQVALFVNYSGERFTRQGLWKVLKQYGEKLGLEDRLSPHILRTSFAVHMIQNGADLKTLQELMGYDDMQAMQVYLQVSRNRIKDVYDKTHPRA